MAGAFTRNLSVGNALIDTLHEFFSESLFADVTLRCREGAYSKDKEASKFVGTETFQLLLASVSPMLREALRDSAEGGDAGACIIVPDLSVTEITEIHKRILFNTDVNASDGKGVYELADSCRLLGIDIDAYIGKSEVAEDIIIKMPLNNAVKNEKPLFACTECGKEYSSEMNFTKHVKTHQVAMASGENNDKENELRSIKKTLSGRTVRQPRQFKDNFVGEEFTADNSVSDGVDNEGVVLVNRRRARKTKFVCGECSKNFSTKQCLRNHELLHKNERAFACGECGKRFVSAGCLSNHIKLVPIICLYIHAIWFIRNTVKFNTVMFLR